ncbi:helix-turn-helix domain-containing protein [Gemella sp. 20925_1_85]|uniref:helix-turn-helix domain-containing protein n=1 Tax=Gemella sp. 20925_1_85 TaxID=3003690 RepID=UPI00352F3A4C
MSFPEEIKKIRQRSFLTQQDFAKKIGVAFSTVNRWESGRAKPNLKAMKNINTFCLDNNIPYETIEEAWLNYRIEK